MVLYARHDSRAAGLEPNSAPRKPSLKQLLLELIDKLFTSRLAPTSTIPNLTTWSHLARLNGMKLADFPKLKELPAGQKLQLPRKFGVIQRVLLKRSYFVVYFFQEPERSLVVAVWDGRMRGSTVFDGEVFKIGYDWSLPHHRPE